VHNLKNISVKIPKGKITTVCGVSGSGKSSLVLEGIYERLQKQFAAKGRKKPSGNVLLVDQSPLSGTPRSTPASYMGILDPIRKLFAQTEQSKIKGYNVGRFSYNMAAGRCPVCEGRGSISVAMHFLSDVWEICEECNGSRYNKETLEVTFKEKNIAEVLDMRIHEALEFFEAFPKISRPLEILKNVGLGYLRLGQSVTTFSGGEAQRMKLAAELSAPIGENTVYLLDEPTSGLHLQDIQILWNLLRELSSRGATLVIVEHHPDIIRLSDWIVELGPCGGENGGFLMYEGIFSEHNCQKEGNFK
jgi:excinuclease ABC subunit A